MERTLFTQLPETASLTDKLRHTQHWAQYHQEREITHDEPWEPYDSPLDEYLFDFELVSPDEGLFKFIKNLSQAKKSQLRALDVGGQGHWLLELMRNGIDLSATAITLVDKRPKSLKDSDSSVGLKIVEGDITSGSTWRQISGEFDLIVCRPIAARFNFHYPQINYLILDKMYRRLARGLLLTQLPDDRYDAPEMYVALDKLHQVPGLQVKIDDLAEIMSIIKTPDAPKDLSVLIKE